jgi:hypothetical protein
MAIPIPAETDTPMPLDADMRALMRRTFWCDFSDYIPLLKWSDTDGAA